jgi:IS5 family transposase
VIERWRAQRSFGDGLIAAEVADLQEAWMRRVDRVLDNPQIVAAVYEALAQRHPNSRRRGRRGTPAEVVLRLLILKHVRNWSYGVLEREVRANLVYRDFTRVGGAKMPDAKTMGRWGVALGPTVIKQIHDRIVQLAQAEHVVHGRRMRLDTTVVETNIHYPTDSSLLGDGVRVLTRTMKKITKLVGGAGAKLRDRSRSVKLRLLEIGRTDSPRQGHAEPGTAAARLWWVTRCDRPGRRISQALLARDRCRRQTLHRDRRAGDAGRSASDARRDDPAGSPGDAADQGPHLRRRQAQPGQAG